MVSFGFLSNFLVITNYLPISKKITISDFKYLSIRVFIVSFPGMVVSKDVSDVLRNQGYWASYNIPYFDEVYRASGHQKMLDRFGDFYSYNNNARARMFDRDQNKSLDMDSMIEIMRHNDFQNDPLSRCNCTPPYSAENSISSRNDLNPINGSYPIKMLGNINWIYICLFVQLELKPNVILFLFTVCRTSSHWSHRYEANQS